MNLDEALKLFAEKGVDGIKNLSTEDWDEIQSLVAEKLKEKRKEFPGLVKNAVEAVRDMLETNHPINRLLKESRNIEDKRN